MIERTPPEELIDLASLRSRLSQIERKLTEAQANWREPARAILTFSGRPVVGSHGVNADFGAKAIGSFTDAVAAVAASLSRALAPMGPIPNRGQNQLLITNVALGSFGFELEEVGSVQLPLGDPSAVEGALDLTERLLSASIAADDDSLTEALTEIDPRALDKLRDFVQTLLENEALCSLQFRDRQVTFLDSAQLESSRNRISRENVHEHRETFRGEFVGALTERRRTFEFRLYGSGEILSGTFAPEIDAAPTVFEHLYRTVEIELVVTRVGHGRPRYRLEQLPEWPND